MAGHLLQQSICKVNADCNFPNGICRDGACMCDGMHEGVTCGDATQTLFKWILRAGVPLLCIIAAVVGLCLGGAMRWCYGRLQMTRKKAKQKSLMFGAGWKDNDRYIGPQHRRVIERRAEKRARKKRRKLKDKRRGRSTERQNRAISRSRSRSQTRSRSRDRS